MNLHWTLAAVAVAVALVTNLVNGQNNSWQPNCLSDQDASVIIEGYTDLITQTQANFNLTLATQLLASDYHSSSDGIDYVRQEALGSMTFTSRQQFIDQQVSGAPFPSVTTLNIYHTCDVITWRYQINLAPLPVRGITIFIVNQAKQIETGYYEVNNGALLYDLGSPQCQANWTVDPR